MGPKNHAYANMAGNQSNFSIGNSTEQRRSLGLCFRGGGETYVCPTMERIKICSVTRRHYSWRRVRKFLKIWSLRSLEMALSGSS